MMITLIQQVKRNTRDTGKPCHNDALLYRLRMGLENTSNSTIVIKIPMYVILSIWEEFINE